MENTTALRYSRSTLASPDFVTPDFDEPLDLEPLLRTCTEAHRLKGLFFDAAYKSALRLGLSVPMGRYMTFKGVSFG